MAILLTRDRGLIWALAQGVRLPQAKLRPFLQPFTHARVELIRGREWWRVVGAEAGDFSYHGFSPPAKVLLARVFNLLRRLLPAEGGPPAVFDELWQAGRWLNSSSGALVWDDFELVLVARLLHHLGYLPVTRLTSRSVLDLAGPEQFAVSSSTDFPRQQILLAVNESLANSHL